MMNSKFKINIITQISILAALASSIGMVDKLISSSLFPMMPGIKLGVANVIILVGIIKYTFKESFLITLIKVLIVSLLFGGITSLLIGGSASLVSYLVMYYIYKKQSKNISIISISVIGGFIHINIQLLMISLIYNIGKEVYIYGFVLIIISLITSIIIGIIVNKLRKYLIYNAY